MPELDELADLASQLRPGQLNLLIEMARAMQQPIEESVDRRSDIVSLDFAATFSNRLLIHHAMTDEKFKKKSFEYAFIAASRSAGREARLNLDSTDPGADVWVDDQAFSLKTEASSAIKSDRITISKLAEARWIRECRTGDDFARESRDRITAHLRRYDRVVMLRAFGVETGVRYDLVEIPMGMLLSIENLTADDFTLRTENGSSRAEVRYQERAAFTLRLDGSVEKVTIASLRADLCHQHASWVIPTSWVSE